MASSVQARPRPQQNYVPRTAIIPLGKDGPLVVVEHRADAHTAVVETLNDLDALDPAFSKFAVDADRQASYKRPSPVIPSSVEVVVSLPLISYAWFFCNPRTNDLASSPYLSWMS